MRIPTNALGSITLVADTIQKIEGYYPGSLSYRLNNPGNLKYAGQPGATPVDGWASFPTYEQGYAALENQLQLYASRGLTIDQTIAKYAPASDGNDPTSYAAQLAAAVGLSVNDSLSSALSDSGSYDPASSDDPADDTPSVATPMLWIGGAIAALVLWNSFR